MTDELPEVDVPPIVEPMIADGVDPDETCSVCDEEFAHVADAPVSIDEINNRTCLTSFGVVFFH